MLRKPVTQIILGLAIAIAVGSSVYFEDIKQTVKPPKQDNPDQAETYLFDTEIVSLNDAGQVSQIIVTPSTVQGRESKQTQVIKPQISLYKDNALAWQVSADTATISADASEMSLLANVLLVNPSNNTQVRTDELHYNTARQVATSNSKITVEASGASMTANGLRFKLADGYYQLHNKVTANYVR
ncbi:MAG TPA: LPS export ABC transporter periplasmic protein LptC [Pseudomonadales bacterium]|nr:LPS export ABC transporter periplasmic protein LptC [Pseudomonadales bacterium]